MPSLTEFSTWKALKIHYKEIEKLHLRDLFAGDPRRFEKFSLRFGDILFDYSKNRITEKTLALLLELMRQM